MANAPPPRPMRPETAIINSLPIPKETKPKEYPCHKIQILNTKRQASIERIAKEYDGLVERIQESSERLILTNWKVHLLSRNLDKNDGSNDVVNISTYEDKIGRSQLESYKLLVSIFWSNPDQLSEILIESQLNNMQIDPDDICNTILLCLYGNFFPREQESALIVMKGVADLMQSLSKTNLSWLRDNNLFTKMFSVYSKNYTSGRFYLQAALTSPILKILENDNMNLEIDPSVILRNLSEEEKTQWGLENVEGLEFEDLIRITEIMTLLEENYSKIYTIIESIFESLMKYIDTMPDGIRFLCQHILQISMKEGIKERESLRAIGELLFLKFISPAIIHPLPYGIVSDSPISDQGRKNLTMIAKVLRYIPKIDSVFREKPLKPLIHRLRSIKIDEFFNKVVDMSKQYLLEIDDEPDLLFHQYQYGRSLKVCMKTKYLNILREIALCAPQSSGLSHLQEIARSVGALEVSSDLVLIPFESDRFPPFHHYTKMPKFYERGVIPVTLFELGLMKDLKNVSDFKKQLTCRKNELTASERDRPHSKLMIRVSEILREMNETKKEITMETLEKEIEKTRTIDELEEYKQLLSFTLESILINQKKLDTLYSLFQQHMKISEFYSFIERNEKEIAIFLLEIKATPQDKKVSYVDSFIDKLSDIYEYQSKNSITEDLRNLIDKYLMGRVYEIIFNEESEQCETLHTAIEVLSQRITPNSDEIKINRDFLSQAPWTLAQRELKSINAYKSTQDMVKCISKCCQTIMRLMTLNKSVGADDFFPVLVFVLIQVNPRNLLSITNYIDMFYSHKAQGEESYWWSQFYAAVKFVERIALEE